MTTKINKTQLLKGNINKISLSLMESVASCYINTINDTIAVPPYIINKFIVKNPDNTLTDIGGHEGDICVKLKYETYFYKPDLYDTIILLKESKIIFYDGNEWKDIYIFYTDSSNSVKEAPKDNYKYGRYMGRWIEIDDIDGSTPDNDKNYSRIRGGWVLDAVQEDVPNDNKSYIRKGDVWEVASLSKLRDRKSVV